MRSIKFRRRDVIGFKYVFKRKWWQRRKRWQLARVTGKERAKKIGIWDILRKSPKGEEYPQFTHKTQIILALARQKPQLDHGPIEEELNGDEFLFEITLKEREGKPQHQERVWKESL